MLISSLFEAGICLWKLFSRKPKWSEAVPAVIAQVLPLVDKAIQYGGANSKEKFDAWLVGFDRATGDPAVDTGALEVFPDIPRDKAEVFWDHIKEAARVYGYCKLKVPGFFV